MPLLQSQRPDSIGLKLFSELNTLNRRSLINRARSSLNCSRISNSTS